MLSGYTEEDYGFQSTPSTRRVTEQIGPMASPYIFQSTPSTRRVTRQHDRKEGTPCHFNPHPPHGG